MIDKKERTIVLSDSINEMTAKDIIEQIFEVNQYDNKQEKSKKWKYEDKKYVRKPIKMIINSGGGVVYDGFAIIAAMQTSKTPVDTYVFGAAMSMGLCISLCGAKRYAHKYAMLMYHEVSGMVWDKLEDHQRHVEEMKKLQTIMDDIVISTTKIKRTKLNQVKKMASDWTLTAKEALEVKMIDEIVEKI